MFTSEALSSRRSIVPLSFVLVGAFSFVPAGPAAAQAAGEGPDRAEAELRWAPTPVTVRSCRGVDCEPAGWLQPGDSIRVWSLEDGWWAVLGGDGRARGYVAASVVSSERPAPARDRGARRSTRTAPVEGEGFVVDPWYYLRERDRFWVRGLVRNAGEEAAGPLLQATLLDAEGDTLETVEFWVASTENIPPGETRPFYRAVSGDPDVRGVHLRVLGRRVW
jgi:hypothetical protein